MKKIALILTTFLLLGLVFSSRANVSKINNVENASKLKSCQKYDSDIRLLKTNPGFYYANMAYCRIAYINDQGSFHEVTRLLEKSAANNFAPAYCVLGVLYFNKYENGQVIYNAKGIPSDLTETINNYEKASELGSAMAQSNLGEIYLDGANLKEEYRDEDARRKDVKDEDASIQLPDINKGVYWLTKAARNGSGGAQSVLSDLYRQGVGLPQDYILAYIWQNLSVASQLRFNSRLQSGTGRELAQGQQTVRDELYNQLTSKQKNQAQNLLNNEYMAYFIEPNALDKSCLNMQTFIAAQDVLKLLNQMKEKMNGLKIQD